MMSEISLSVLICSVHSRYKTFGQKIQDQVWQQLASLPPEYQDRIEVLMLTDNKQMMLGQKRNDMVDMAQGKYVQFIDDDDRIEPDMFRTILDATHLDADVITFLVSVSLNGGTPKICKYSREFEKDNNTEDGYERLPNHICVVKRNIATRVSFPNKVYGEDATYAQLLQPLLRTEYAIDKVLYHYDWSDQTSETQEHRPGALRMRKAKPLVDVVMMSKANTPRLRHMTQLAIDTCIAGANSLPVNVIVLEQQEGVRYEHAQTVFAADEFHYNRFANRGAQLGFAEWIMVANNDLVFHDGWLHALLAAKRPVVSPRCPRDIRQAHHLTNAVGYSNAVHFSGWCFMIQRALWHRIGGFDEDVSFWCSDDAVLEQLKDVKIVPMLVLDSRVEHLASATLRHEDEIENFTWPNVVIFNEKYGANKFANDERFNDWRARQSIVELQKGV